VPALVEVGIVVEARQPTAALRALSATAERVRAGLTSVQQSTRNVASAFAAAGQATIQFGRNLEQNTRKIREQATTVQGLVGAYAGFRTLRGAISAGVELESVQKRAELLTARFSQLSGIQQVAAESSNKFRLAQTDTLASLVDLGNRLGPQGATINEIRDVYEGFNTILAINKVSTTEAAAAQLQLNQALGAGRLQGDEFRSVNEATPQVIDEIAKVLKIARGEVKEFAAEGKVTAPILIQALRNIKEQGADVLQQSFDTAGGRLRAFEKAQKELAQAIGTQLLPAFTPLLTTITDLIAKFAAAPGPVKGFTAAVLGVTGALVILGPVISGTITLIKAIGVATLIAGGPWIALAAGITAATFALASFQTQSEKKGAAAVTGDPGAIAEARKELVGLQADISLLKLKGADKMSPRTALGSDFRRKTSAAAALKTQIQQGELSGVAGALNMPDGMKAMPGDDTTTRKRKGKTDAERLAEQIAKQKAAASEALAVEKGRLLVAQTAGPLQRRITEAIVQQNQIQRQYSDRLKESKSAEETLNLQLAQRTALQTNALELQQALSEETDRIINPLKELTDASAERLQLENKYQELLSQGINPELAKEFAQLELAAEKQTELLTLRLAELEGAKAKLKAESDVAKALQEQIDKTKEILQLQGQAVAKSKQESEEERKKRQERERRDQDAKEQAERLKGLYRGVVNTIEDGIVDAIQVGIDGLINGTKELDQALKEIAAGVLQDIGRQLVRFGVNMLMRGVFPGAFANGGVFAANGIQPFASGGIVNKPTLFPFAEGGTTRTGLMGEAGPEAIMPLRRNSDGRLGVDASGLRSAMGAAPGSAGGFPVLNMSFETTNIGGVEYVSREQLEAAMAATRRQAANDGARKGMTMTIDKLQQSPATRRQLGI